LPPIALNGICLLHAYRITTIMRFLFIKVKRITKIFLL
jgi:hypothetical protein